MSDVELPADPHARHIVNLALVVGNGFTLDCITQLGLYGIDVFRPVEWPLTIPKQLDRPVREALPAFYEAFDRLIATGASRSHFDLLRDIVASQEIGGSPAEVETRHFLTLAYRFYSDLLSTGPLDKWRWTYWLRAHTHVLVTSVSFNYDCLLERVLTLIDKPYDRRHHVAPGITRVFKPHGSADFDLVGLVNGPLKYPLQVYGHMNNGPFRIVPGDEWSYPPSEPLIVLPYERNPYINFQWAAPGYSIFWEIGPRLTHCVFVGLSYHRADRAEINHFLYSTAESCRIIVADTRPPSDLVNAIRKSGREVHEWRDGPERLPLS